MRPWEEVFTDADREVLHRAGLGKRQKFGKRPALLLIDFKTSNIGTTRKPILEAIKIDGPSCCGEAGWDAALLAQKLLAMCRENGVTVVHVTGDAHYRQFTSTTLKAPYPGTSSTPQREEVFFAVAPLTTELVIRKAKSSAFWGTPLASCLHDMGIDSLLVAGCTTSGCLRASVTDARNEGLKCFVVEECCYDRFLLSHLVNLWDLNAKFADVITLDQALRYVEDTGKLNKGRGTD